MFAPLLVLITSAFIIARALPQPIDWDNEGKIYPRADRTKAVHKQNSLNPYPRTKRRAGAAVETPTDIQSKAVGFYTSQIRDDDIPESCENKGDPAMFVFKASQFWCRSLPYVLIETSNGECHKRPQTHEDIQYDNEEMVLCILPRRVLTMGIVWTEGAPTGGAPGVRLLEGQSMEQLLKKKRVDENIRRLKHTQPQMFKPCGGGSRPYELFIIDDTGRGCDDKPWSYFQVYNEDEERSPRECIERLARDTDIRNDITQLPTGTCFGPMILMKNAYMAQNGRALRARPRTPTLEPTKRPPRSQPLEDLLRSWDLMILSLFPEPECKAGNLLDEGAYLPGPICHRKPWAAYEVVFRSGSHPVLGECVKRFGDYNEMAREVPPRRNVSPASYRYVRCWAAKPESLRGKSFLSQGV